ncbi:MAG: translocation/assembly module TamB domain-containing protein [Acidobacteriota bacterium]|nr:translocation/assembly module TamB domain-containing protein [Acidobacteriota bacterium]
MAESSKTRRTHTRLWIGAAVGVVLLALVAGLVWYLRSPQFADFVRGKVVAAVEDASGGKVELGAFHWNLAKLQFEGESLTVHGLEGAGELPYVHVDKVHLRLRIVSFVERRMDLDYLGLERPVVHLIVNADGRTNAPEPKVKPNENSTVQQLFDLAIARADLRDGMLLVNDHAVPLDFSANDLTAEMAYDHAARRYDGTVRAGKLDVRYQDYRDVVAQAETEFSLWHNALQVKLLKVRSEQSSLEAHGKLTDFGRPKMEFTYESSLDAAQAGAVARVPALRGGTVAVNGSGTYSEGDSKSRGTVAIRKLEYAADGVALRNANLDSDFVLENDRLLLRRIAARLLGGEVTGDAEVTNLLRATAGTSAPTVNKSAKKDGKQNAGKGEVSASEGLKISGPGPQQGTARLRVSRLSLSELAGAISTRSLPLDQLNAVGSVAGTVDLTWKRSWREAEASLALDVVPPMQPAESELPVSATIRGRYDVRGGVMDLSALSLSTRQTHLDANGTLGLTSAALKLNLKTTSLTEFQPLLNAMGGSPLPVELGGEADFSGTLAGRLKTPQIAGHLQATNFTYLYVPAVKVRPLVVHEKGKSWFHTAATPEAPKQTASVEPSRRIHVDQFSGDVQYGPSAVALHNAFLQEGGAHITLDGTATLDNGNFSDNSPFQLRAAVQHADAAGLQRALGLNYPVTGTLTFNLQATGTTANPNGEGHLSLTAGEAYGRPIKSLTSNIVFANHEAQLHDIHLQAARGVVEGSASYNLVSKAVSFDLKGESIKLAELPELQAERLQTAGIVDFTAKGSGTSDEPVINAHVQVSRLVLNGDAIGGITADAVTRGRQLQLAARSSFPKADFKLDGTVELSGEMVANVTMQFTKLDIDPFLRTEVKGRITSHSSMAGHATLSGPLKQPRLLNGIFKIDAFSVEVERIPIASDGPIELTLANQTISVQRCSLVSEDSRLTLTGSASLSGERSLDLRAEAHVNLKLVHVIAPDIASYGITNLNLAVNGSMAKPSIVGRVTMEHGGLSMIDVPSGLGDINGTLVFNQDRLEVENLTARSGGGLVTLGGFVTYGRTVGFNLTMSGTEIRFRYAGISVTSDQKLHLTGTLQNANLGGDITVTRFAQIPSTDLKFAAAQASQPSRIPDPTSPLNNLHLDVRIVSSPELTVQTSLAKLSGDVDLRLRGTAARPVLLGRINVAEGDIKLNGTRYHLDRGDVTFTDPVRIDPVLDIQATTRVRDYDITIGLHGTVEKLNTTYRSDPPLSSENIVALLAFGRTQQEIAAGGTPSSGFAETASGAMLSQAINQTVGNRVSKLFGVSSIRINPSVGGPDNNPNARLTVEQQVSNNVTFTYITNLAQSAQQVIQFEYNINSEYTIQGIRDENGVVSLDLLVRKRKR